MKRTLNRFKKILNRFVRDQSGVTAIEYGLIAALVAVAIIGGVTLLGTQLDTTFDSITTALEDAQPVPPKAE